MTLRIAPDLELPVEAVTQSLAILARRGAGKTYTASVLVEEVIGASVPVVVLDPTGAWWGLRSSVDGERPGLPVVIFGGEHGDVPLEEAAGVVLADVVVEHPGAYVLDLSGLPSKRAEQRFAADFLERLYRAKSRDSGALLVVVDEADMFAPQRPGPEQTRTLGALESIVRRGRIKGLGVLLITQRAAVLNKNVLTQTEVLIVMQTTGPQDRDAIDAWIEGNGTAEERAEVLGSLASLERGEAWVWSPAFLRLLRRVRIRERRTFDSSRTPGAGEAAVAPTAFAKVDLDKLGARIAATIEKQKADDPRALRKRITDLERQVAERPTEARVETVTEYVDRPVLDVAVVNELARLVGELLGSAGPLIETAERLREQLGDAVVSPLPSSQPSPPSRPSPTRGVPWPPVMPTAPAPPTTPPAPVVVDVEALRPTERGLLTALAQYPAGRTQTQAALLAGYSANSGGVWKAVATLRRLGYVEGTATLLRATDAGRAALGSWVPLPTGRALVDYWLNRLKPTERGILGALIEAWPNDMTQAAVAEKAGYSSNSGGVWKAVAQLRKLDLIDGTAAGLRASDDIGEHR